MNPRTFVSGFYETHGRAGAYTVVPVLNSRVLDLPFHVERCATSAMMLSGLPRLSGGVDRSAGFESALRRKLVAEGLLEGIESGLLTICAVVKGEADWEVQTLVTRTPTREEMASPAEAGFVDVTRALQRTMPLAKATSWTVDRVAVEKMRLKGAAETLLVAGDDDAVLEGLVSNFYCVKGGSTLYTAPRGTVLPGSMGNLVEQLAIHLGFNIVEQSPRLQDCHAWDTAFLTSATKPIVPIRRIVHHTSGELRTVYDAPVQHPTSLFSLLTTTLRQGLFIQEPSLLEETLGRRLWF